MTQVLDRPQARPQPQPAKARPPAPKSYRNSICTLGVVLLALVVLWFAHGIVFAGVQFGWAVMALAEPSKGDSGGKRQRVFLKPSLVPHSARDDQRNHRQDGL